PSRPSRPSRRPAATADSRSRPKRSRSSSRRATPRTSPTSWGRDPEMRSNERNILFVVGALVLVAAFWFLIIGPKQKEASDLGQKIDDLNASVDQANQQVQFAQQARRDFPANYGKLVMLGKAVPENADSASYLVQLNHLAKDSGVDFRGIELDDTDAGAAPAPAPTQPGINNAPPSPSQPSTEQPGAQTASNTGTDSSSGTTAAPAAAPPTEATASTLAI